MGQLMLKTRWRVPQWYDMWTKEDKKQSDQT